MGKFLSKDGFFKKNIVRTFTELNKGLRKYEELIALAEMYEKKQKELLSDEYYHDNHRREIIPVVESAAHKVKASSFAKEAVAACKELDEALAVLREKAEYYKNALSILDTAYKEYGSACEDDFVLYENTELNCLILYNRKQDVINQTASEHQVPAAAVFNYDDNNLMFYAGLDEMLSGEIEGADMRFRAYLDSHDKDTLALEIQNGMLISEIGGEGSPLQKANSFLQSIFNAEAIRRQNAYELRYATPEDVFEQVAALTEKMNKERPDYNQIFSSKESKNFIIQNQRDIPKSFISLKYSTNGLECAYYYNKKGSVQKIFDCKEFHKGFRVLEDENYERLMQDPIIVEALKIEGLEMKAEKEVVMARVSSEFELSDLDSRIPYNISFIYEACYTEELAEKMMQKADLYQGRVGMEYEVTYCPYNNSIMFQRAGETNLLIVTYDEYGKQGIVYSKEKESHCSIRDNVTSKTNIFSVSKLEGCKNILDAIGCEYPKNPQAKELNRG